MPPQPAQSQDDQQTVSAVVPQRGPSRVSRRSLLRGAAGVGAMGIAAAGGAGAAVALTRPATPARADAAQPAVMAAPPPNAMAGPLVVYLRDTTTGELDVFAGTGQVRLHDPALVRQLLRALT